MRLSMIKRILEQKHSEAGISLTMLVIKAFLIIKEVKTYGKIQLRRRQQHVCGCPA